MFSYVLLKSDVEMIEQPLKKEKKRVSASRAAAARMWPAWYYLTGIVPLASARMSLKEFNASAKVAREGPFDRKVENHWFEGFSKCARAECVDVPR